MPAPRYVVDARLKEWATPFQAQCIDAVNEHRSIRAAGRALGRNYTGVRAAIDQAQKKAAIYGYSPEHDMTKTVPAPFVVKGVSTYYNNEGKPAGQWVKSALDQDKREEIVREAIKTLSQEVKGLAPLTKAPSKSFDDLLAVYPMGDPHFGMYAWAKEAGDNFDLDEAERLTLGAIDRLIQAAPASTHAVFLPLGDVFHTDDQTNTTPAHKNQLDADGRYVKILQVGIRAFRHAILRLLEKHQVLTVRFVAGNHDPHAIWALSLTMAAYFENEPRVTVDLSPAAHWYFRFGKVLLGATHGDTTKHAQLPGVMASDMAPDWGATLFRYWYTGHVHTSIVNEFPGVTCESFRTLAARDAWSSGRGYRAGRDMRCIVHHKDFGEIERHRCDVAMLEAVSA